MLSFVGLGLYDQRSITLRGREVLRSADRAFLERYTSTLAGTSPEELEAAHEVTLTERDRAGIERDPEPILSVAEEGHAVVLVGGDPMVSTTHVDLRLRATERDIPTRIVHGTTAQTAASSLTGLQNYRFGKATTLPFPETHGGVPDSVTETIAGNRERGLHTLVYLDIDGADRRYMRGDTATDLLADHVDEPGVVVARAGSDQPLVRADALETLAGESFGPPLHLLVVPGELHPMEREALVAFGGAPESLFG
jgi:diphthine synthase